MLYDQDAADLPARAEDIVGDENGGETTALTTQTRQRLADPDNARFLIDQRIDEELRRRWSIEDVEERLQRYVVLDYPTEATAEAAFRRLSRDRNVLSVEFNETNEPSVQPSDPLFHPYPSYSVFNYQWAIRDKLSLSDAWDITRGTAYVGVVDFGIQVNHPDLQEAYRPQFAKNIANPASSTNVDELVNPYIYGGTTYVGHGTHVAGIISASTHDPTVPANQHNHPEIGTAGACWRCSLVVAKANMGGSISDATAASSIAYSVQSGAQAINMSFGNLSSPSPSCGGSANTSLCDALELADAYEVTLIGASGNENHSVDVQFPAFDPRVIPVGGIQPGIPDLWQDSDLPGFGSRLGPQMAERGLLAPARDILSTVYSNYDWAPYARCGDSTTLGSSAGTGYGTCTGTSMAAPHVTGIVALMRTTDPMQPSSVVRSRLLSTADNASSPNNQRGYGVPRANLAVNAMVNGNPYRLTPLFAQVGACGGTRFYTVVPQMAMAAFNGTLPVGTLAGCKIYPNVLHEGTTINSGKSSYYYPGGNPTYHTARAQVWVFSTHNPRNSSLELKPLYRLSRRHGSETLINHVYSTDFAEVQGFINTKHYQLDGIEGYVYPANLTPPTGAVRLKRASKDSGNAINFAVFPETLQSAMQSQGYIYGTTTLGWAFPNNGNRPTY